MKWCEIFRTGIHKDSCGNKRVWTLEDLNKIKENFYRKNSDVPICCGHPKSSSPAYGWVEDLKIAGERLFASYKNVQPEFKEAVKKGLFKNRSISLNSDLSLRHVAFLGGQLPAIKGLEQFCFSEIQSDSEIVINFSEKNRQNNENLFGEIAKKNEQIRLLQAKLAKSEKEKNENEFREFCDSAISKGHLLPSQKSSVINLLSACKNEAVNFQDGNEKSTTDLLKEFVLDLKQINFEETAAAEKLNPQVITDFNDTQSIKENIIALQKEYKGRGIFLNPAEALKKLKEKKTNL